MAIVRIKEERNLKKFTVIDLFAGCGGLSIDGCLNNNSLFLDVEQLHFVGFRLNVIGARDVMI